MGLVRVIFNTHPRKGARKQAQKKVTFSQENDLGLTQADWDSVDLLTGSDEAGRYSALEVTDFGAVEVPADLPRGLAYVTRMQHSTFVGKRFVLADNDRGFKAANPGNFQNGAALVRPVPDATSLAALLDGLGENDAITLGRPKNGATATRVLTKYQVGLPENHDAIARSKSDFHYPPTPGWLMIDVDPKSMPADVRERVEALGGLVAAIHSVWPELRGYCRLIRPSSSAGVHRVGTLPDDLDGLHIFVLLPDVSKSPDVLRNLHARCWEHGLAWWMISASGSRLDRGVIDVSVASPERLSFEAAPILDAGLVRDHRPTVVVEGDFACPPNPPSGDGWRQNRRDAWDDALPDALAQRAAHRAAYIARMIADRGVSEATAAAAYGRVLDGKPLGDAYALPMPDGTYRRVGDFLDDLQRRHAAGEEIAITLPDPIEGHAYHHSALLRWGAGYSHPAIHSLAHGQPAFFVFERYESQMPTRIAEAKPVPPVAEPVDRDSGEYQDERLAGVQRAADELRAVATAWAEPIRLTGAVRNAVRDADADADGELAQIEERDGLIDDDDERNRVRNRLRRAGRKAVRDELNLAEVPNTAFRAETGGYAEGYGSIEGSIAVTGLQGIGKTATWQGTDGGDGREAAPGLAHSMVGANVFYAQPTTDKAVEARTLYQANESDETPISVEVRGRLADDPQRPGEKMCLVPKEMSKLQASGESVRGAICSVCAFNDQCGYMRQIGELEQAAESGRGVAVFGDQSYIRTGLPVGVKLDGIVTDEMDRALGVAQHRIAVNRIKDLKPPRPRQGKNESDDAFMDRFNRAADKWQKEVGRPLHTLASLLHSDAVKVGASAWILPEAKRLGLTPETLYALASVVGQGRRNHELTQRIAKAADAARNAGGSRRDYAKELWGVIDDLDAAYPHEAVAALCRVLAAELAAHEHGKTTCAAVRWVSGREGYVLEVTAPARMAYGEDVPIMHLDGTGSAAVSSFAFGRQMGEVRLEAERNCEATYIAGRRFNVSALVDGAGKAAGSAERERKKHDAQRLRAELVEAIHEDVRQNGDDPDLVLTVMPKKLRELLEAEGHELPGGVEHFGAIRGVDKYKHHVALYMIASPMPPSTAIDAVAVAMNVGRVTDYKPATDGLLGGAVPSVTTGGNVFETRAYEHPDPDGQVVLEQTVFAEMMQAVDRLRLLWGRTRKRVTLMTDFLLPGLPVDHVREWDDFSKGGRMEVKLLKSNGFVPLAAVTLSRLSGEFKRGPDGYIESTIAVRATNEGLSRKDARPIVERAEAIRDIIGFPGALADAGLPSAGRWFELKIRLDVPEGEKRLNTFPALGTAGSPEEMDAKVRTAFAGTRFKVRTVEMTEIGRNPELVQLTNMPVAIPGTGEMTGEYEQERIIPRDLLPDHLRDRDRLMTREVVGEVRVVKDAPAQRYFAFAIRRQINDHEGDYIRSLHVLHIVGPATFEMAALRMVEMRDVELYDPEFQPADREAGEHTSRPTMTAIGNFAALGEAMVFAEGNEPYFDAVDGAVMSDDLRARIGAAENRCDADGIHMAERDQRASEGPASGAERQNRLAREMFEAEEEHYPTLTGANWSPEQESEALAKWAADNGLVG